MLIESLNASNISVYLFNIIIAVDQIMSCFKYVHHQYPDFIYWLH